MKKYQLQVVTSESFLLNGTPAKFPLEKALADLEVDKKDLITLVLGGDISHVHLTYEIYQTLKDLGYVNIDFSGTTLKSPKDLAQEKHPGY